MRVYTSLVVSSIHRVTIVCGKKTSVMEVIQLALSKIGKADLDSKGYVTENYIKFLFRAGVLKKHIFSI